MITADQRLERLRQVAKRLFKLLDADDRNALVQAEIAHQAAHLGEHFEALDRLLMEGGELPALWQANVEGGNDGTRNDGSSVRDPA
jgi:hypothetical protein